MMDMYSLLGLSGFILCVSGTQGFCLFGEQSAGCVFQCHCQGSAPCNDTTGSCPGGCQDGVLGVSWRGAGCQTGNIALQKTAKQSSVFNGFVAKNAIDGRVDGMTEKIVCAHTNWPDRGWWEVDLGGLYKVHNITIYNRKIAQDRLSQIWIAVRNASTDAYPVTNTELCYENRTYGNPGDIVHIQCYRPVVGRHIRLSKYMDINYNNDLYLLNFCEFIAIGHLYVACEDGNYGSNCKEACGKCRDNAACDRENGGCSGGCQLWYAGTQCKDYIELHGWNGETAEVTGRTNSSLEVSWQPLSVVRADLAQFYGYTFYYRISGTINFTKGIDLKHSSEKHAVLTGLAYNTEYDIYIAPYRQMQGDVQHGMTSPEITGRTACDAPDEPVMQSVNAENGDNGLHNISITLFPMRIYEPRCDAIMYLFIEYKVTSGETYTRVDLPLSKTSYVIESLKDGSYSVRLTVVNNQNISAASDGMVITVGQNNKGTSDVVVISVSVVVVVIVVAVTLIIYLVLRHRRKNKPSSSAVAVASTQDTGDLTSSDSADNSIEISNVQIQNVTSSNAPYTSLTRQGQSQPETPVYVNTAVYEEIG